MPLYFQFVGTIADFDETTQDSPLHPSPIVLLETDDKIERVVLPKSTWSGSRHTLQIGRRLRVAGHFDFPPEPGTLPVAFHVEFIDVH